MLFKIVYDKTNWLHNENFKNQNNRGYKLFSIG